ncbi:MAG: hypothetical protein ACP5N1_03880 [Candidatus Woesearchaeota archaeon]
MIKVKKLTKEEKQVLTLLDDAKVDDFEKWAQLFIKIPITRIKKAVQKFKKLDLINTMALRDKNDLWYFHTGKVTEDMIDENTKYKRDYGCEKPLLGSLETLEKKIQQR